MMFQAQTSTQTFVIYSSLKSLDLNGIYSSLKLTDQIVGAKYDLMAKGDCKPVSPKSKNFLKCLTLTLKVDTGKKLSVKLFCNGSIQVTGCKLRDHATECVDILFRKICPAESVEFVLVSVMLNVNFSIGFKINREKLGGFMNSHCDDINLPPLTMGYMGLKFKLPVSDASDIVFPQFEWNARDKSVEKRSVTYSDYFADNKKKIGKKFMTSVEIFQNGKVLISGVNSAIVERTIEWIGNLLLEARRFVEIKTTEKKTFVR